VSASPVKPRGTSVALLIVHTTRPQTKGEETMLNWSITFLIIGLIAGVLGFTGIAGAATQIAWVLFVVFLVLFLISLVMGRSRVP
jgi:uncharacterized membrane protein YtjA (UPF0391 family)